MGGIDEGADSVAPQKEAERASPEISNNNNNSQNPIPPAQFSPMVQPQQQQYLPQVVVQPQYYSGAQVQSYPQQSFPPNTGYQPAMYGATPMPQPAPYGQVQGQPVVIVAPSPDYYGQQLAWAKIRRRRALISFICTFIIIAVALGIYFGIRSSYYY
jgi:hypothetical protein